eukprot:5341706-Pleurochrysis_carterae.AAC.1
MAFASIGGSRKERRWSANEPSASRSLGCARIDYAKANVCIHRHIYGRLYERESVWACASMGAHVSTRGAHLLNAQARNCRLWRAYPRIDYEVSKYRRTHAPTHA